MTKINILETGYFNLARTASLKVDFRSKVGAVLVRSGKPISIGQNHPTKTHPILRKYNKFKTMHAEIDACIGIDRHLTIGSTLYVYREKADGSIGHSKPCEMCEAILKELQIKRVFYTISNEEYGKIEL